MVSFEALRRQKASERRLPPPPLRRAIRENAGASQALVGEHCHVRQETVSRWESGARTPRGAQLEAYVRVLDELLRVAR